MRKIIKLTIFFGAIATMCTPDLVVRAQQPRNVLPAPFPAQIYSGRKVFVSNAGGDSNHSYSGEPQRLYNQFYAALKSWGRYDLAGSRAVSDPQFRLVILDPGTRVTLWVFTEHIEPALLQGNRDKNFDQALNYLLNDLRNVAG